MTLQSLVTSKDLSEKLKSANFPQESLHYWFTSYDNAGRGTGLAHRYQILTSQIGADEVTAAPTSDELLAVLPATILKTQNLYIVKYPDGGWSCEYDDFNGSPWGHTHYAKTLANAAAGLVIELLEQGHIKHKEAI
jgi:hypothetical protein